MVSLRLCNKHDTDLCFLEHLAYFTFKPMSNEALPLCVITPATEQHVKR